MVEKKILDYFLDDKYEDTMNPNITELLKIYVKNKPLYLNEIKLYLLKYDTELYKKYSSWFNSNVGMYEAFNIKGSIRNPNDIQQPLKKFESLKPVYQTKYVDKKKSNLKKRYKTENKKRFKQQEDTKLKYEEKMSKIKNKIRKG